VRCFDNGLSSESGTACAASFSGTARNAHEERKRVPLQLVHEAENDGVAHEPILQTLAHKRNRRCSRRTEGYSNFHSLVIAVQKASIVTNSSSVMTVFFPKDGPEK